MDNEIYHWGIKLGGEKKNHKYFERINTGTKEKPKYRYFYTKAEYQAYLKGSKLIEGFKNLGSSLSDNANKSAKSVGSAIKNYSNAGKSFLSNLGKNSNDNNKGTKKTSTSNTVKNTYAKAKDFINQNKNKAINFNTSNTMKTVKEKTEKAKKEVTKKVSSSVSKVNNLKNRINNALSEAKSSLNTVASELTRRTNKFSSASNIFGNLNKDKNSNKAIIIIPKAALKFITNKAGKLVKQAVSSLQKTAAYKQVSDFISSLSKKTVDTIDKADKIKDKIEESLFKPIKEKLSPKQERDKINPYYEEDPNYQSNCYSCSISYDLRQKGLDVKAIPDVYGGMTNEEIESIYKDGHFIGTDFSNVYNSLDPNYVPFEDEKKDLEVSKKLAEELKKQLLAQSDGKDSSGFTVIRWYPYGGHIFNYEIVNGKVTFIDTQPSANYSGNNNHEADIVDYLARSQALNKNYAASTMGLDSSSIYTMRTDNLEIDESRMAYVTCPSQIGASGNVSKDLAEQTAWVYLNMYNNYTEQIKKGEISRNEDLYPIGGYNTYITYNELEQVVPQIIDILDDYNIDADWIDNLENIKK